MATTSGGDPLRISAREWNAMRELVRRAEVSRGTAGDALTARVLASSTFITVRNDAAVPLDYGEALTLTGPQVLPSLNAATFRSELAAIGRAPQTGETNVCIAIEPIPAGGTGRAVVAGLVPARINVPTGPSPTHVAGNGSPRLGPSDGGIPVFYVGSAETGTAARWAWLFLGPATTTVNNVSQRDGAVLINNCDVNDCLSEGSPWADVVESDICAKVPHQYEIGGGLNLLTPTTQCCDGKIWNEIPESESGAIIAGPKILTRGAGLNWFSEWFECADLLQAGSNSCGSAVWEWRVGTTRLNCAYTWRSRAKTCSGYYLWTWDVVGEVGVWVLQSSQCGDGSPGACGGLEPPAPPTTPGAYSGFQTTTPCVPVVPWEWVQENAPDPRCPAGATCAGANPDPLGGPIAPTSPPTGAGQLLDLYCSVEVPTEGLWVMIQDCACGTATPPSTPGAYDRQRATTGCGSVIGDGDDGYSQTLTVRWRLQVLSAIDARLQLLDQAGKVYYDYRLPSPRQWCCLCANSLVYASCGPHWDCPPFAAVCVRPHRPDSCRVANGCEARMVEVTVSGFADPGPPYIDITQTEELYNYDGRRHAARFNGVHLLESGGAADFGCYATSQTTFTADLDGEATFALTVSYVSQGGPLNSYAPGGGFFGPGGGPVDGPAVRLRYVLQRSGAFDLVFGEAIYQHPSAPTGNLECGVDTEFELVFEQWMNGFAPDTDGPGGVRGSMVGDLTIAPPTITVRARE